MTGSISDASATATAAGPTPLVGLAPDDVPPSPATAAEAPAVPASPRAALAAELAAHVARLLAAGDLEAARVAHEAMGRLLAAGGPATGSAHAIDVAAARREDRKA